MSKLHDRPDLPELIAQVRQHRERTIRQWDAGELDGDTFAREDTADRLLLAALEEALEIRQGRSEPTPTYDAKRRFAAQAIEQLREWRGLDDELRDLLGDG